MLKLYAAIPPLPGLKGHIRDIRPTWLLEEMGQKFEVEFVANREEFSKDWFLAMNPFGKIPVLRDDDFVLFESVAICIYLADKFQKFIPAPATKARALHDQWLMAAAANFEFPAFRIFVCDVLWEQNADTEAKRKNAWEMLLNWLPGLERHLKTSTYLTGKEFQVCDILMASILRYVTEKGMLTEYPSVVAYVKACTARPAFQRAHDKNGQGPAVN